MVAWIVGFFATRIGRFLSLRIGPDRSDAVVQSKAFSWAVLIALAVAAYLAFTLAGKVLGWGNDAIRAAAYKERAACVAQIAELNERNRKEAELMAARIRAAEARERQKVEAELEEAVENVAALERELAKAETDPVVIPQSLARELRK
jgi:hypothetical protein